MGENKTEKRTIKRGDHYYYFKGHLVQVVDIAKHNETEEIYVISGVTWTRPYNIFVSEVDHKKYPSVTYKYRYRG